MDAGAELSIGSGRRDVETFDSTPNAPTLKRPNAERPNAKRPNAKRPNAERPNAKRPNAKRPNAQTHQRSTLKRPNASYPSWNVCIAWRFLPKPQPEIISCRAPLTD